VSKFFIYTFGCRCNQADSAAIRESLHRSSFEEAGSRGDAELFVVNSCTITHRTDQQVRQTVRKICRENPDAQVVVTGCYAERDPEALASIRGVNLVVGNAAKDRLAEIIQDDDATRGRIIRTPLDSARDYLMAPMSHTGGKTRPFIKLQDGCSAQCSYCIVPAVRGPGRSAAPDDIVREVQMLVQRDFKEIVLTGVHLGTYGLKLEAPTRLVDLLRRILDVPGLGRLRLSSIEPMRFDRSIVKLAAQNPVFSPHFHLPLQSGSDRILRRMRRPYRAARFLNLLEFIHSQLPTAALGTDILVGFPGESDQDFKDTCELVCKSPLTYLHVFPFSARQHTDAWSMPDAVSPDVIRQRASTLRRISQEKNLAFRRRFLGRLVPALTLAKEEEMGESVILTENYIHARVENKVLPPNQLVQVRIDSVQPSFTTATIVSPA